MSSDHLLTPDRAVMIGERTLTLSGTFGTLKKLQHAFGADLLPLQASIIGMRQDEIAKLIAVASGADEDDIGQLLLDELDVTGSEYRMLKAELLAWLAVAMTPRKDRQKKVSEMTELLAKLQGSRGASTGNSPSASSAGARKRSGKVPSGT